ncbi:hypothetical protein [Tumebacillus flagellatus]|uniref:Uncharacterized protein n=1 Tax=Tumebacillus flagellatus TaxID=1157490 RepID=A0A074M653_9BACL|nr:hypothetical protein [Tumebacillus flagellatus]KEO81487.1 hypothetical protein EL26_20660 [Tumebacillus flagellatus]
MIQATKWQVTMIDNGKLYGGTGDPSDVNVSAVAPDLVKQFCVSSSVEPSDSMYLISGKERWYRGGRSFTPLFPLTYSLADGTTLTIVRNSEAAGDLFYTQQ